MKKFRNGWIFVIMLLMVAGCMLAPTVSAAPAAQTGSGDLFPPIKDFDSPPPKHYGWNADGFTGNINIIYNIANVLFFVIVMVIRTGLMILDWGRNPTFLTPLIENLSDVVNYGIVVFLRAYWPIISIIILLLLVKDYYKGNFAKTGKRFISFMIVFVVIYLFTGMGNAVIIKTVEAINALDDYTMHTFNKITNKVNGEDPEIQKQVSIYTLAWNMLVDEPFARGQIANSKLTLTPEDADAINAKIGGVSANAGQKWIDLILQYDKDSKDRDKIMGVFEDNYEEEFETAYSSMGRLEIVFFVLFPALLAFLFFLFFGLILLALFFYFLGILVSSIVVLPLSIIPREFPSTLMTWGKMLATALISKLAVGMYIALTLVIVNAIVSADALEQMIGNYGQMFLVAIVFLLSIIMFYFFLKRFTHPLIAPLNKGVRYVDRVRRKKRKRGDRYDDEGYDEDDESDEGDEQNRSRRSKRRGDGSGRNTDRTTDRKSKNSGSSSSDRSSRDTTDKRTDDSSKQGDRSGSEPKRTSSNSKTKRSDRVTPTEENQENEALKPKHTDRATNAQEGASKENEPEPKTESVPSSDKETVKPEGKQAAAGKIGETPRRTQDAAAKENSTEKKASPPAGGGQGSDRLKQTPVGSTDSGRREAAATTQQAEPVVPAGGEKSTDRVKETPKVTNRDNAGSQPSTAAKGNDSSKDTQHVPVKVPASSGTAHAPSRPSKEPEQGRNMDRVKEGPTAIPQASPVTKPDIGTVRPPSSAPSETKSMDRITETKASPTAPKEVKATTNVVPEPEQSIKPEQAPIPPKDREDRAKKSPPKQEQKKVRDKDNGKRTENEAAVKVTRDDRVKGSPRMEQSPKSGTQDASLVFRRKNQ
ncbi:hypothetical protein J6TS7_20580 [Paenibacillus dendritiformis]|uniref:hypothetical protein n=1 Tax=Paenibacillus TaxID=44249 RepID=UPI001B2F1E0F|nr:hypothetical protein [Paenibacillus dendritiformis]GIO78448.1 hypothetical protein J6TS7_20580 [Paenibacillus dendritiformis]